MCVWGYIIQFFGMREKKGQQKHTHNHNFNDTNVSKIVTPTKITGQQHFTIAVFQVRGFRSLVMMTSEIPIGIRVRCIFTYYIGCPAGFVIVRIVIVSWFISPIYGTYNPPTYLYKAYYYIGVIIHLLSTMDIPVLIFLVKINHSWIDNFLHGSYGDGTPHIDH